MPPKRRHRSQDKKSSGPVDPGPLRPFATRNFAPPRPFPPSHSVRPPLLPEEEVAPPRADPFVIERGHVSQGVTRSKLGKAGAPILPEPLQKAVDKAGRKGAAQHVWKALEHEAEQKRQFQLAGGAPEVGSFQIDDQMLRRAFTNFDLDKNEVVGAKELKHIFAQLGEMPKDTEIDAMIALCDARGDGAVSYEDFLAIFSCMQESMRGIDIEALQDVWNSGEKKGDARGSVAEAEEEDDEGEKSSSDSSGSSLEARW